jgi:general stress protein YciG
VKKKKLKLEDPDFFQKIGRLGGEARKKAGVDYSALAVKSHPRAEYHGGRPKKTAKIQVVKKEK